MAIKLFKVLLPEKNFWSKHPRQKLTGGYSTFDYTSYLPTEKKPGKWLPHRERLLHCHAGWHVTARPSDWHNHRHDRQVFEVQVKGKVVGTVMPRRHIDHKVVCHSFRLVREIKRGTPEWKRVMKPFYQTR